MKKKKSKVLSPTLEALKALREANVAEFFMKPAPKVKKRKSRPTKEVEE